MGNWQLIKPFLTFLTCNFSFFSRSSATFQLQSDLVKRSTHHHPHPTNTATAANLLIYNNGTRHIKLRAPIISSRSHASGTRCINITGENHHYFTDITKIIPESDRHRPFPWQYVSRGSAPARQPYDKKNAGANLADSCRTRQQHDITKKETGITPTLHKVRTMPVLSGVLLPKPVRHSNHYLTKRTAESYPIKETPRRIWERLHTRSPPASSPSHRTPREQ